MVGAVSNTLPSFLTTVILTACATPGSAQSLDMIDVGGHRLEALIKGEGSPAVVFDAGFIRDVNAWRTVQDAVAQHARTLAYERAGLGGSEVGPEPRTAEQIARELHSLLVNAGISSPVILVGHSAGGMFIRVFAAMYRDEVAALVLVDPATEDMYDHMRTSDPERWDGREDEVSQGRPLPPGWYGQWSALPQSIQQARRAWPLPDVPIVVFTGLVPLPGEWELESPEQIDVWHAAHVTLVGRLPTAEHIVLPNADHFSILQAPVVSQKIVEIVQAVAQGSSGR